MQVWIRSIRRLAYDGRIRLSWRSYLRAARPNDHGFRSPRSFRAEKEKAATNAKACRRQVGGGVRDLGFAGRVLCTQQLALESGSSRCNQAHIGTKLPGPIAGQYALEFGFLSRASGDSSCLGISLWRQRSSVRPDVDSRHNTTHVDLRNLFKAACGLSLAPWGLSG